MEPERESEDRRLAFAAGILFALVLITACLVFLGMNSAKRPLKLDPAKAVSAYVPFSDAGQVPEPHVWFKHECCDCGLSHRVLMIVQPEGIQMYWWGDWRATRKARVLKGMTIPNPFHAESGAESRGER